MSKDDFPDLQSAALRLRCIEVLTHIDEETLRIVDSVLGRLVPGTRKPQVKRRANTAGGVATPTSNDSKGGVK